MTLIGTIFSFTYCTKHLNTWPASPTSHVTIYSQLSACPGEIEPLKGHPSIHTWRSGKPQKQATAKAARQFSAPIPMVPEIVV